MAALSLSLSFSLSLLAFSSERADDRTLVWTDTGWVRGLATPRYRSFRGLPFAAPPLGRLRWSPPAPVVPWPGVRNATAYRHNCLQPPGFDPDQPRHTLSEDCLYLNVWTPPDASRASSLPVFFWVHGGGFQHGGANESRLNGTWLAARYGAVVVTTNYRLNIFGFLGSRALRSRDASGGTGNYGVLDQRAALQWVQRNIASFGGDPGRVLLAGESAGGASVYNHLVRPRSWGLFSRAAAESGAYSLVSPQPEEAEFERTYERLLAATGCAAPACLEELDADVLVELAQELADGLTPAVDGVDLTAQIATHVARGEVAPSVPFISGGTREDLGYPLWPAEEIELLCEPDKCTEADFALFVSRVAPAYGWSDADRAAMVAAYSGEVALRGGNYTRWYWAARHMGADYCMVCPARRSVMALAAHGRAAFLYLFAHAPDGPSGAYPKLAHHASEIPFVFHDDTASGPNAAEFHISPREWPLADLMAGAWTRFAAEGAPPPFWPQFEVNQSWLVLGQTSAGLVHQLKLEQCDLWDRIGGSTRAAGIRKAAANAFRGPPRAGWPTF
ncbi:hypothetical protein AB1Y20_021986 [Prymnesium parvum]|uniref:Carboxylic ester hydrolase n=1 Tax=Prymnesium parvum TaxID=97485 RepID=A0AB34JFI7_PRYPA